MMEEKKRQSERNDGTLGKKRRKKKRGKKMKGKEEAK